MASLAAVGGIPGWAWMGIGGMLFVVAAVAVVLALRQRAPAARAGQDVVWDEAALDAPVAPAAEPSWQDDLAAEPSEDAQAPEPAVRETAPGPSPYAQVEEPVAGDGPVHHCRCPGCQTQFTVTGAKPIVTNCPGCGKKGFLR